MDRNYKTTALAVVPVPIPPEKFEQDRLHYYTTNTRYVATDIMFSTWLNLDCGRTFAWCRAESPIQRRLQRRRTLEQFAPYDLTYSLNLRR